MGFNSAFEGLNQLVFSSHQMRLYRRWGKSQSYMLIYICLDLWKRQDFERCGEENVTLPY